MNEVAVVENGEVGVVAYRRSTDAAGICADIVKKTAKNIKGRKYVCVEGWQAIAIAHGCAASARNVEVVHGGIRAIGEVRRMSDGMVLSTGEGFVGDDESTWAGRAEYARRAMAQTRAISRACRSCFAHVVVLIDAGLSTTPAEEIPDESTEHVSEPPKQWKLDDDFRVNSIPGEPKLGSLTREELRKLIEGTSKGTYREALISYGTTKFAKPEAPQPTDEELAQSAANRRADVHANEQQQEASKVD